MAIKFRRHRYPIIGARPGARFDARTALRERKSEKVGAQDEISGAIVEGDTPGGFLLSQEKAAGPVGGRKRAEERLRDPGAAGVDDADRMMGQTCIDDGDTAAEALGHLVSNRNDFGAIAIDVAPSTLAFDGGEILGKGLRGLEARRDYGFSSVIDKPPGGSERGGEEGTRARRLLGCMAGRTR